MLTSRMRFRAHGPAVLLGPLLARILARDSRRDEARLKLLLEQEDGRSSSRAPANGI